MNQEQQLLMAYANCHRGDLDGLLKGFFKFLHDYTDLYVVDENPVQMGFKPGQAEAKILNAFKSFPYKSIVNNKIDAKSSDTSSSLTATKTEQKQASGSYTTKTTHSSKSQKDAESSIDMQMPKTTNGTVVNETRPVKNDETARSASSIESHKVVVKTVEEDKQQVFKKEPEIQVPVGNGGTGPGYTWTQTLSEVTVYIPVAKGTRGKQIKCELKTDSIHLGHYLLLAGNQKTILEGRFPPGETIDVSESSWCLNDDNCILIMLTKRRETWWDSVIDGHPKIDATKVDSKKRVSDYDPETQAAIRKLIVEQNLQLS